MKKSKIVLVLTLLIMSFAMSITVFAADQSDGLVKQLEAHQDYIHYHVDFDQIYDKANYVKIIECTTADMSSEIKTRICDKKYMLSQMNIWFAEYQVDGPIYLLDDLEPGRTYYVFIGTSQNEDGPYTFGKPYELVTTPKEVQNIQFVSATDTSATIIWDKVPGAGYYIVEQKVNGKKQEYPTTLPTYQVPMGEGFDNAVYVYAVRESESGFCAKSPFGYIYNLNVAPKTIPVDEIDISADSSPMSICVKNVEYINSGAEGVEYEVECDGHSDIVITSGGFPGRFKYRNGSFYHVRARQYVELTNGKLYSDWSKTQTVARLKNLCVSMRSKNQLKLKWKKISGAKNIIITMSDSYKGTYRQVAKVKGSATTATIKKYKGKKLKANKKYYFKVYPADKYGKSVVASEISGRTTKK